MNSHFYMELPSFFGLRILSWLGKHYMMCQYSDSWHGQRGREREKSAASGNNPRLSHRLGVLRCDGRSLSLEVNPRFSKQRYR